jgi:membrane protein YqaA with SNARE-associated domain
MQWVTEGVKQAVAGMGGVWGGVGLLIIAFFDSSFLSLPEINDLLIIYFCTRFKQQAYYFALMATIGSVAGCTVLYYLGKWKGYSYLERRYTHGKMESAMKVYQRYGVFALIGPALLPPPFPFKIFVLSAGICGLSFPNFFIAVVAGRGFRYFFEAAVAIRYGDLALAYIGENYTQVAVLVIAVIVFCLGVYLVVNRLWMRQRATTERPVAISDENPF